MYDRPCTLDSHELELVRVGERLVVVPYSARDQFSHQHTQNQKCNTFDLDAALRLVSVSMQAVDIG